MNWTKGINLFLTKKTIEDINKKISGELDELRIGKFSYFYGNGELIMNHDDHEGENDTEIFFVDRIGFNLRLVRG